MATEQLMSSDGPRYFQMPSELSTAISSSASFRFTVVLSLLEFSMCCQKPPSSPSLIPTDDIRPMLLSYTIEFLYKQFKWQLVKKASHVFYLHFTLKKRAFIEEIREKQEQVVRRSNQNPMDIQAKETMYLLKGKVKVTVDGHGDDDGSFEIGGGDLVVFAKGMNITWEVIEGVKKHYHLEKEK